MSNHRLKKDLRKLRVITPNPSWQAARRDLLMRQVEAQTSPVIYTSLGSKFLHLIHETQAGVSGLFSYLAAQGVAVSALVILLLVGSGGYVVAAADNSLPNERLYGLKIAVEEARLRLATSPKARVALEIELASRRLDELERLHASAGSGEHFSTLVGKFEERLVSATSSVSNGDVNTASDRADIARMIDAKVAAYEHSLSLANKSVSGDVSRTVERARVAVSRAETQALKVIVEESSEPQEAIAQKIDDKIKAAEENLKMADSLLAGGAKTEATKAAQDQSAVAKDNLAAAKQKIVEGDYKAAIGLLEGVEDIVNQVVDASQNQTTNEDTETETPAEGSNSQTEGSQTNTEGSGN